MATTPPLEPDSPIEAGDVRAHETRGTLSDGATIGRDLIRIVHCCFRWYLPVLALPLCASCLTSSAQFLEDFSAYAVARGEILKVENLTMEHATHLQDGLAVPIHHPGCLVTMDFSSTTQVIEIVPGGIVVFSTGGDLLILPLKPAPTKKTPQSQNLTESPETGGTPAAAGAPKPELLKYVLATADLIESGSIAEATKRVNELPDRFPKAPSVQRYQQILQAGLAVAKTSSPAQRRADPKTKESKEELAKRAYSEATSLVAKSQYEAARQAFERAYALNAGNPAVTEGLIALLKKMGLELYSKGKLEEAVTHWQRALEIKPKDEETLRYLKRARTVSKRL